MREIFRETIRGASMNESLGHAQRAQEELLRRLEEHGCTPRDIFRIRLTLEEALVNGIKHGNYGLKSGDEHLADTRGEEHRKRIIDFGAYAVEVEPGTAEDVLCESLDDHLAYIDQPDHKEKRDRRIRGDTVITFRVQDQGEGFSPDDVPDPTEGANLERASGRGLLLMRSFMDALRIEKNDVGTLVTAQLLLTRAHVATAVGPA